MPYSFMKNKKKVPSSYKTLYLSNTLIEKVNQIAEENETSFNNVVVSMIEYCLSSGNRRRGIDSPVGFISFPADPEPYPTDSPDPARPYTTGGNAS